MVAVSACVLLVLVALALVGTPKFGRLGGSPAAERTTHSVSSLPNTPSAFPRSPVPPPQLPPPLPPRDPALDAYPVALAPPPPAPQLALPESWSLPGSPGALPTPRSKKAPPLPPLPFQEAHWQGLELIPFNAVLARALKIPPDAEGVIVDEATMPADSAGFLAGDLVTAVARVPTPGLMSFIWATDRVRDRHRTDVQVLRRGKVFDLVLTGMFGRLGTANGETAQTIPPGSRPPHGDQGPCTNCHRIGTKGQLPVDQGDLLSKSAPMIYPGQARPHGDRGTCTACHKAYATPGAP